MPRLPVVLLIGLWLASCATAADVTTLKPQLLDYQSEEIRALAFNSDGTLLAVSPQDNDFWLCDPKSAKFLSAVKAMQKPANLLFAGPRPDLLYSVEGFLLRLVNLKTGETVASYGTSVGISGPGVLFPRGDILATPAAPGGVELLKADLGRSLTTLTAPDTPSPAGDWKTTVAAISPDGKIVAGARPTGKIYLWTLAGTEASGVQTCDAHSGHVEALAFAKEGLVSLGRDGQAKLWNPADGQPRGTWSLGGPLARGWLLADGQAAAVVREAAPGEVQLYYLPSGDKPASGDKPPELFATTSVAEVFDGFALAGSPSVTNLALSPDRKVLALSLQAGQDGGLRNARVPLFDLSATLARTLPPATSPNSTATGPASTKPPAATAAPRTWTSADGKFQVEATLVSFRAGIVTLRRVDNGKLITLKLDQLSPADQQVARAK
ncbi:MAG: SHD1 domain-containing protein [Pirellulaceae bacterium]|nr:SHD1 domain-containing protein [Pirellulaceae bacterium]